VKDPVEAVAVEEYVSAAGEGAEKNRM